MTLCQKSQTHPTAALSSVFIRRTTENNRPLQSSEMLSMSQEQWRELSQRMPCVHDFKLGPAPAPLGSDSYPERWLKLVWMEEYYSMLHFKQEHSSMPSAQFQQDASLSIKVNSFDQEEGAYRVTVQGTDPSRDFALPEDMALPGDFAQAILKLPKGWIYLRKIFPDDDGENQARIEESHDVSTRVLLQSMQMQSTGGMQVKMEANGEIFTEEFDAVLRHPPKEWQSYRPCILFNSFSTCTRRFSCLHQYPKKVHKELRRYIEACNSPSAPLVESQMPRSATHTPQAEAEYEGPLLLPMPTTGTTVASTNLNAVQQKILEGLKTPLDFVQGPPGTGKSFFIVELLRTRIPPNKMVLLCTTTNKAIDSLADKICATCGHDCVVAIGNPHRLGATSVTLTLDEKVKRHHSKHAWVDMCTKATRVMKAYHDIQQGALNEARNKDSEEAKELGIPGSERYSVHEQQVKAGVAEEMGAAARAAEEVARVRLAASNLRRQGRQGKGSQKGMAAPRGAASQAPNAARHIHACSDSHEEEAEEIRVLKALAQASQGMLTQHMRPHIRKLKRMLLEVQVAAKKFVAETAHPDIVLGWIWSTILQCIRFPCPSLLLDFQPVKTELQHSRNLLPDMNWFLSMKLRVSVGLLEEFKVFSSNVLTMHSKTVDKLLRIHFLRTAQYVVCTAASAANIAECVKRDVSSIRKGLIENALDSYSVLRLVSCECSTCSSCYKPTGSLKDSAHGSAYSREDTAASADESVPVSPQSLHVAEASAYSSTHVLQGHEGQQLLKADSDADGAGESAADIRTRTLCERTHDMLTKVGHMSISTQGGGSASDPAVLPAVPASPLVFGTSSSETVPDTQSRRGQTSVRVRRRNAPVDTAGTVDSAASCGALVATTSIGSEAGSVVCSAAHNSIPVRAECATSVAAAASSNGALTATSSIASEAGTVVRAAPVDTGNCAGTVMPTSECSGSRAVLSHCGSHPHTTTVGHNAGTCSCSFVYRTYACSKCRDIVQHLIEDMDTLLKVCKRRRVPAAAVTGLEEAVAAENSGGDKRRDQMIHRMLNFQHVVLDEAGAMLEPDMIGTVIHGCRFLLCVGDHLQLPPFTQWKKAESYSYNVSLLQRLAERPGVRADHNLMVMQYRMHPSIACIVSDIFYRGQLTTAPSVIAARRCQLPVQFIDVPGSEQPQGTSFNNTQEARKVMEIVRDLLNAHNATQPQTAMVLSTGDIQGHDKAASRTVPLFDSMHGGTVTQTHATHARPLSIDVIAFHKPQVYEIRHILERERSGVLNMCKVDVTTVDSMQGREADVVILSCVRTGDRQTLGFLTNKNRLNVALSRARECMYIVGNGPALQRYGKSAWAAVLGHNSFVHRT